MTPQSTRIKSMPSSANAQPYSSLIAANAHHLPLLSLWGMQFAAAALLGQLDQLRAPAWTVSASFWLAFAATLLHVIYYGLIAKRQPSATKSAIPQRATGTSSSTGMSLRSVLGFAAILVLLLLLPAVLLLVSPPGMMPYTELYRALVLAGLYLLLGRFLSRRFTALALWLVLLAFIMVWAYLGFAPLALGVMSGLSLIACHLLLRRM